MHRARFEPLQLAQLPWFSYGIRLIASLAASSRNLITPIFPLWRLSVRLKHFRGVIPAKERVKKLPDFPKGRNSGPQRRTREGGYPYKCLFQREKWISACAGMTVARLPELLQMPAPVTIPDMAQTPFRDDGCGSRIGYQSASRQSPASKRLRRGCSGFTSSRRSGSPQPARMAWRASSRNRSTDAKSLPEGMMALSSTTLSGVRRGNH